MDGRDWLLLLFFFYSTDPNLVALTSPKVGGVGGQIKDQIQGITSKEGYQKIEKT